MTQTYDIILRNGTLYDGSGAPPVVGDLAINGEMIVALGDLGDAVGKTEIDVSGLAVAPGFINMLSWAPITLLHDGRSQSDIRQGVTLEVMGESWSEGPLNEERKKASRPISPRLLARPRYAFTPLAIAIATPRPKSWRRCATLCARP